MHFFASSYIIEILLCHTLPTPWGSARDFEKEKREKHKRLFIHYVAEIQPLEFLPPRDLMEINNCVKFRRGRLKRFHLVDAKRPPLSLKASIV
jgi:hypothetical protein